MMPHLTKSIFSLVSFMNLHLKTCVFLLLVSLESLMNVYFVSLAQGTFDCSSNVTTTVQILHFLYIHMRRCFLSNYFISGQRLHIILSPEMKFYF